ncbi:MAG: metallophosphoesterase [Clostridia bacterium]|nr:metallophosphoesterase [Clostridia bacterium]
MKRTLSLLLSILLLLPSLASCSRRKLDEPIEFIIANDIHYISPSLLGDGEFFRNPTGRADGKVVHYITDITDAFIAEVIEKKPQALILAGDLTLNGAIVSHSELANKLAAVKNAGIDVLIIPGNHDFDQTAVDYSGDTLKEAEGSSASDFYEIYDPLLPETLSREEGTFSYIYQASDDLWVLMLDTNTYAECYVMESTFKWAEEQLHIARESEIDVIAVSHQNIYEHSDLLSFGYQLYNGTNLQSLYEKYSVICNFSGHIHVQSIIDGDLPEIATSSLAVTGLHYGKITYNGKALNYATETLGVAKEAEGYTDFSEYATYYFEKIAIGQAHDALGDSGLSESEIELMAKTYAEINSAYFEGKKIDPKSYAEGIELWRTKSDSFISRYIDSMLENTKKEQSIKIRLK